jgi:cellulose synthase/poly-beta-1,6-N-acetylglucosamine synthase-like glycosyltransferase
MIIIDIISIVLLSVLLFWTVYNGSIIIYGIRAKRKEKKQAAVEVKIEQFPKFSIIVPTKNEEKVIRRCLDGLVNIDYPKDKMEVIVVDGNSSDDTVKISDEFSEKYPCIFKVVKEKESKGKPTALNSALPYVSGEIVGIFDADSLPERQVLRKVAACFLDEQVKAVQGRTDSLNEKFNALTRVIAMEERAWFQALLEGKEKLHLFVPLTGSCQFVKREVLEELGGWDASSLTEDVELALRMVEKNHFIKYAPDICSQQETPCGLRALFSQRVRWYRGYMEAALKYGRLLDVINRKTVDAEVALAGPFMMVVSLLSYVNWFLVVLLFSQSNPILNFTGLVIALTAASLIAVGVGLTASEKPIKLRNLVWIPAIYAYWLLQMFIAAWAFLKLVFRRKRVWTKTVKSGYKTENVMIK